MKSYETKTNRKKLINAYCEKFPLAAALYLKEDTDVLIASSGGRLLLVNTAMLTIKTTKNTSGVAVMTQKKGQKVASAKVYNEGFLQKPHRYRAKNLPAAGSLLSSEDSGNQLKLI